MSLLGSAAESIKVAVKEAIVEAVAEQAAEAWIFVKADLIETSYAIVLIGGTICIILYVAGWEKGMRWAGILFVSYVLLRTVLGGA